MNFDALPPSGCQIFLILPDVQIMFFLGSTEFGIIYFILLGSQPVFHAVSVWPPHPVLGVSKGVRAPCVLPTALLLVPPALQPAKGTCLPGVEPLGCGSRSVASVAHSPGRFSTCEIPLLFWVPSQAHRPQPDHFSSFPTWFHVDVSYSLGCTRVFLPVSVQWDGSTWRCIFDMFLEGGEFHSFPAPLPWSLFSKLYFFRTVLGSEKNWAQNTGSFHITYFALPPPPQNPLPTSPSVDMAVSFYCDLSGSMKFVCPITDDVHSLWSLM